MNMHGKPTGETKERLRRVIRDLFNGFTSLQIHPFEVIIDNIRLRTDWFIRDEKTGCIMNRDNNMQYYINPIKPFSETVQPDNKEEV